MKNTLSSLVVGTAAVAAVAGVSIAFAAGASLPQAAQKTIPAPADVGAPPQDAQRTPSGLATKVLRAGTGKVHPTAASYVAVHYTGWTTDGQMFDSSVVRGEPETLPLGRVIPGWTEGVQLMVQGEIRRLWIPVELAYKGREGRPKGMLVFDVELIEIDPPVTIVGGARTDHRSVKGYLTRAAAQVPDALYTYRPTPEVRSFGQLFAHVADSNYAFCAAAAGTKPPVSGIEKAKTTKAEIEVALGESFAYCDTVFASMTDADAAKPGDFFGRRMARISMLTANTSHNNEHYGNIVTYLRLNKMVPPSSQR